MLQIVPRLNRFLWHLSITSFIAKSSFHLKVQRSPSAHKDHPHTCQLGLCVRSMFKVRQKRKRRRGHAGYLSRKIMREHLDTCPSRWSSCPRKQFLPSAWKTTAAVCHPSAPCFLPDTIHIFGFHSAPDFKVKGEMWSRNLEAVPRTPQSKMVAMHMIRNLWVDCWWRLHRSSCSISGCFLFLSLKKYSQVKCHCVSLWTADRYSCIYCNPSFICLSKLTRTFAGYSERRFEVTLMSHCC